MRDYKRPRRSGLEGAWVRPFTLGLALGLAVAVMIFLADHRSPAAPITAASRGTTALESRTGAHGRNAGAAATARNEQAQAPNETDASADGRPGTGSSGSVAIAAGPTGTGTAGAAGPGSGLVTRYDFYQMLPRSQVLLPGRETEARLPAAAPVQRPGVYFLQIGSYHDAAVADRVRLQVQKLGVTASVQRIVVDTATWHRVRVGPIRDLTELNRLRRQLQGGNFEALVVRVEP